MKRSWFRRLAACQQTQPQPTRPAFAPESLEKRVLFAAPHPTNVIADNRGEVIIQMDQAMDPTTIKGRHIQMQTVGPDGLIGTADDEKVETRVRWRAATNRVVIMTNKLPADTTYRIRMNAKTIKSATGEGLDGEWNGGGNPFGDGVPGHDVLFISRRPKKGDAPTARFTTSAGSFNVKMFLDDAPQTVVNFMNYANAGRWDGTFFHRLVNDFVVQGGGYWVDREGNRHDVEENPPVVNEFGRAPIRGTIAMAKLPAEDQFGNPIPGGGPDSATNEWFFNFKDNSDILNDQNGGFTVFGEISTGAGILDTLNAMETVNAGSPLDEVPVNDRQTVINRGSLDLRQDIVSIRRVAMLNKILQLTFS